MKMDVNCGATSAVGSWNEPTPGSVNSADCWFVMSICSLPTVPSFTWLASGLRSGDIFETRSRNLTLQLYRETTETYEELYGGRPIFFLESDNKRIDVKDLGKLSQRSIKRPPRVVVITDNARYHHARLHRNWREEHANRIVLDYLPPYSPDLNPIERVWKLTRRQCLHNRYFPLLSEVTDSVEAQFRTVGKGKHYLASLMRNYLRRCV